MSLEDIRSECSDTAALLQPYVDGELAAPDEERVAEHVTACRACRAAVDEQLWVRATLRAVEREQAPVALRGRILAALDAVEAEQADDSLASAVAPRVPARRSASSRPSLWSRAWSSFNDVARGALVMLPAGAVAIGLFFVARDGMVPVSRMPHEIGAGLLASEHAVPSTAATNRTRPGESLPPAVVGMGRGQLQLVGAQVSDESPRDPGARLRYEILRDGRRTGRHVVDHQLPLGTPAPAGQAVDLFGHLVVMDRTAVGGPTIHFESAGMAHRFTLEGGEHGDDDITVLLELAQQMLPAPSVQ
ncbi:MAG TPA: zf-HC2 domain-containing protein [Nannocystaceae bacterium]|nr:zf-HC2 domain-containing protein [Nannocystaceae bacterium]